MSLITSAHKKGAALMSHAACLILYLALLLTVSIAIFNNLVRQFSPTSRSF